MKRHTRNTGQPNCANSNCGATLQANRNPSYECTCPFDYCSINCYKGRCELQAEFSSGPFCVLKRNGKRVISRDAPIEVSL
jgi:hypothetical protein